MLVFPICTTLAFFLFPSLHVHFEYNHFVASSPFLPLLTASPSFCWGSNQNPRVRKGVAEQHVLPTQVLPLEAGRWGCIAKSTVFFKGCEQLQDHSHRLLTEAAIGSDKKKEGSIPTGPQNNRDKSWARGAGGGAGMAVIGLCRCLLKCFKMPTATHPLEWLQV